MRYMVRVRTPDGIRHTSPKMPKDRAERMAADIRAGVVVKGQNAPLPPGSVVVVVPEYGSVMDWAGTR